MKSDHSSVQIIEDMPMQQEQVVKDYSALLCDDIPNAEVKIKDISEYLHDDPEEKTTGNMEDWEESLLENYDNVKRVYEVGHKAVVTPAKIAAEQGKERMRELRSELPSARESAVCFIKGHRREVLIGAAVILAIPLVLAVINNLTSHRPIALNYLRYFSVEVMLMGIAAAGFLGYRKIQSSTSEQRRSLVSTFWLLSPYIVFLLIWALAIAPLLNGVMDFLVL